MKKLYGDGIHDDTEAIQELIDIANHILELPMPKKCYLISKSLEIPSNFQFVLPRYAEIKLADNSNCVMLKNQTRNINNYILKNSLWSYVDRYDKNFTCENIQIYGGIWNCNNLGQLPNPLYTKNYENGYNGFGMLFYNMKNFTLKNLTIKDPINFAITLDTISYFTVEDIQFDFNYGNPYAINMDGVHVNGNCHYGTISNIKGACYDDEVALNADEGSCGPITNITISKIYAENSHSAVRLLTRECMMENIHITDIYGTYYQYCIGLTKYYPGETKGMFSGIVIENIFASKAQRLSVYKKDGGYVYPLIYMEDNINCNDVYISNVHRNEFENPVETIYFGENASAERMSISNVVVKNHLNVPIQMFVNKGNIKKLNIVCSDDIEESI